MHRYVIIALVLISAHWAVAQSTCVDLFKKSDLTATNDNASEKTNGSANEKTNDSTNEKTNNRINEKANSSANEKIDEKQSLGQQIFEIELNKISDQFQKMQNLSEAEKIKQILNSDMRMNFFKLQALARIFRLQNKSYFKKLRIYFKDLEGAIGKVDLAESLLDKSKTLEEPVIEQQFQKQLDKAHEELIQLITASGLSHHIEENIQQLKLDILKNGNWLSGEAEKAMLVDQLSSFAEQLHKEVVKRQYTNDDLELGLHKLRRQIRWVIMQVASLDGLVTVGDGKFVGSKIDNLYYKIFKANPLIFENKYLAVSEPKVSRPIKVPRVERALIADYALQIGRLKDKYEANLYLKEAIDNSSLSAARKNELYKLVDLKFKTYASRADLAQRIQIELSESKLLKKYAEHLRLLND